MALLNSGSSSKPGSGAAVACYLLLSSDEVEALNTAYWLICYVNCTGEKKPDGTCPACRRILAGNHPDVFLIDTEENKQSIAIDQIRPLKQELAKSLWKATGATS